MKRMLLVLTVALIMALVLSLSGATAAFGDTWGCNKKPPGQQNCFHHGHH